MRIAEKLSFEEVARRFDIRSKNNVFRRAKRLEPCEARNKPATKIDMEALAEDVKNHPDACQHERAVRLGVSESCVQAALKRLKISHKKTLQHPKADPDLPQQSENNLKEHQTADRPIIYVDESGFAHDMPRTHGYAPVGKRCVGNRDWHAKGRTHVIGALLGARLLTAWRFVGPVNGDVFLAWVEQDLLPKAPGECVMVMDNASFHQRDDIEQAMVDAGHILEYLPAYSPELNPIEHKWAQAKAIRRQCHCSVDEVFQGGRF